eukprot:m.155991 g.155991  ORF g.155991 m.155991 type:complete len:52 (+) comp13332_c0_seq11:1120-1275(+)
MWVCGSFIPGLILIAIIVYLIVQVVRTSRSNRVDEGEKIDLDIELSQATLY